MKGGAADLADAARQLVGNAFREHILDFLFLAVILVPLGFVRRDPVLAGLRLAERHLRQRENLQVIIADQAHIDLTSLDQLLDNRRLVVFGVDELDTLRQGRIVFDNGCLGDPDRRILEQRLHDQRKPQLRRPHQLVALVELGECRHADAVIRFIAGNQQCGRR